MGIRSLRGFRFQRVGASHSQMRRRSRPAIQDDAAVVGNLQKLGGGSTDLPKTQLLKGFIGRPRILLLHSHLAQQSLETGLGTQGVHLGVILD
jgi:hypothetical protein